jgi:hypothetical protein
MSGYRVPSLLALGGLLVGLALLFATQPYSVSRPWSRFDEPAHRYLEAALRRDSSALERLSATPQPVHWAIRAEQIGGDALATWVNSARAVQGFSRGDTIEVWYDTPTDACPFLLAFVGQERPRLVRAHARCYKHRGWPSDPSVVAIPR